jgi:hypothetical protein
MSGNRRTEPGADNAPFGSILLKAPKSQRQRNRPASLLFAACRPGRLTGGLKGRGCAVAGAAAAGNQQPVTVDAIVGAAVALDGEV